MFPVDLLRNIRQVVYYWNGRYVVHRIDTIYAKIFELTEDYADVGFEDLDEDAGYSPDYDYANPRLRIFFVDGYLLFSILYASMSFPVQTSWIYYMTAKIYEFTKPGVIAEPRYVLVEPKTGRIIAFGDHLKHLIKPPAVVPAVVSAWGENIVRVGTSMKIYATAEGSGLTLKIVINKPDGTKIEGIMTDLGDGNYVYEVYFDQRGQYLIEVIYPDGFKKKKIVIAY